MSNTTRILRFLRISLHVLVAVLLAVGMVNAGGKIVALLLAASFALLYLAGTVYHNRGGRYSPAHAIAWLVGITALWVFMTLASPSFAWLEFPLVILASYLLPVPASLLAAALILCFTLSITGPASGVGGLVGPTIGTGIAVLIFHSYTALRREAEHYKQLAADLEAAQLELAAAERAAGVAAERARLSREVHDTIAQGLSSIVLLGRALDKQLDRPGDARETLDIIRHTAADNLTQARRIVAGVSGAHEPLTQRIDALARSAEQRQRALGTPLRVTVNAADLPGPAADVAERVVREALSNIVRHAHATEAVITVDVLGDQATIDVYDDGVGIGTREGFGLTGLRARVEEAGGALTVEGNVLAATIPV
ncbi:sensor histidine kinase [Corynebacterium liangguodongii]|uniref:sensor histidine kinase n=1 Tax=Corynebacterium liangguodongii TaxID=2079535 RepID=UPI001F211D00|nr:histidine kinase [Corynebacterium liangguodongii]